MYDVYENKTLCRRRSRNIGILCRKPVVQKTTKTRGRKGFWTTAITLVISCWMIHTSQAASLLNGRFETTTDVTDYLNLALDAAKMAEAGGAFDTTMDIYTNVSLFFRRCANSCFNAIGMASFATI